MCLPSWRWDGHAFGSDSSGARDELVNGPTSQLVEGLGLSPRVRQLTVGQAQLSAPPAANDVQVQRLVYATYADAVAL